jgi:hypothetical protein
LRENADRFTRQPIQNSADGALGQAHSNVKISFIFSQHYFTRFQGHSTEVSRLRFNGFQMGNEFHYHLNQLSRKWPRFIYARTIGLQRFLVFLSFGDIFFIAYELAPQMYE